MPKKSDTLEWSQAINRSKSTTMNAFQRYANRYFWREYDLQGYMYKALYREPLLRPYIRREHRIWNKDKQKQLLVLDFALLDPNEKRGNYPDWSIREMIQLKYPVEFKTGWTEPDNLIQRKVETEPSYYQKRCRTRIRAKTWEDYRKYQNAVGKAKAVNSSVHCHILYFDVARRPSYSSDEDLIRNFKKVKKVDLREVGPWDLTVTYTFAKPKHLGSDTE